MSMEIQKGCIVILSCGLTTPIHGKESIKNLVAPTGSKIVYHQAIRQKHYDI